MVKTFDEWFISLPWNPCFSYYDFAKEAWEAAQAAEREACAKICDGIKGWPTDKVVADECAEAIRARGNK